MKSGLGLLAAAFIVVPAAMASSTTCQNATLDQYLTPNFSCISGNLLFSNFSYTPTAVPTGVMINASAIRVTPITTTGDEGFQFSSGWNVGTQPGGSSSDQDSLIVFTVSTVNGAATLEDLSLFFNGSFSGTGLSGVAEQYCLGGSLQSCPQGDAGQLSVTNPPPKFNDASFFTPVSSISVSKDINVTSGINGTANISQVINTFSQLAVPEPASYFLLGGGLMALGLLRRRSRRN